MNSSYFRTMLSISKNEFNVIGFLIRKFSKRFTIRNIAFELKISSAGAHAVLKKLEKNGIVKAEKLGTGLFYEIDLNNKIGRHLAAISLISHFELKNVDFSEIEKESKAVVFDGKKALVITNDIDSVKDICYRNFKDMKLVCKSEDEFSEALMYNDEEILGILGSGNVIFGEELIVDVIKRVTR